MTSFLFIIKLPVQGDANNSSSKPNKDNSVVSLKSLTDEETKEGDNVAEKNDRDDEDAQNTDTTDKEPLSPKWDFEEDDSKRQTENESLSSATEQGDKLPTETESSENVIDTNNRPKTNEKSDQPGTVQGKEEIPKAKTFKIEKVDEEKISAAVGDNNVGTDKQERGTTGKDKTESIDTSETDKQGGGTTGKNKTGSIGTSESAVSAEKLTSESDKQFSSDLVKSNSDADFIPKNISKSGSLAGLSHKSSSSLASKTKDELTVSKSDSRLSNKGNDDERDGEEYKVVKFLEDEPLIEVTKKILEDFSIENVNIQKTENGKCYQVLFVDEGGERCENILNRLASEKIGDKPQTSISIFPASIYRGSLQADSGTDEEETREEAEDTKIEGVFRKSIKARMLVTQVVDSVKGNAQFTFDFLMLIVIASFLAGLGLVENSSVILVASMLVSPIMGPILAGTFGTVIQNNSLRNLGIKSEIKGLLLCVFCGLIFGFVTGGVGLNGAVWGSTTNWPSDEMKSRGLLRSLWVGLLIALPSGVGVALSVLGGNTGSLVGVAISAALLPPAVNAGMLWAYSMMVAIKPPQYDVTFTNVTEGNASKIIETYTATQPLGCKPFLDNTYSPVYSCNMAVETAILGSVSLFLTLLNITCIFLMGIIFLKIKEVAPQSTTSEATRDFWSEDIQIVKESYSTMKGPDSVSLGHQAKQVLAEWRKEKGHGVDETLQLQHIMQEVENSPDYNKYLHKLNLVKFSRFLAKDFQQAEDEWQEERAGSTTVIKEATKSGYDVYKTYHGGHILGNSTTVRRRRPIKQSTIDVVDEKSPSRGKLDRVKSAGNTPEELPIINLKSSLYNRRKKQEPVKKARFEITTVKEEEEKGNINGKVKKQFTGDKSDKATEPLLKNADCV